MKSLANNLIFIGLLIVLFGIAWNVGSRFIPLGNLPGDITIETDNVNIYIPITTMILLSVLVTIVLWLFGVKRS